MKQKRSHNYLNLVGDRYGKLVVIQAAPDILNKRGISEAAWICKCDCGKETIALTRSIRHGNTRSCGCVRREYEQFGHVIHGDTADGKRPTEYLCWCNMRRRCSDPSVDAYQYYGARGITVCERWVNSYENFIIDMGRKPSAEYTIDRINNDGNYEPENCRWATKSVQAFNRRAKRTQ